MDYVSEATRTLSKSFHDNKVYGKDLLNALDEAITALQKLDKIKKAIFYGKGNDLKHVGNDVASKYVHNILNKEDNEKSEYLFHGIIGAATEVGELLEELVNSMENDKKYDIVNLSEELGDVFWYMAILSDVTGIAFEEMQKINIEKLKSRYPEKFTEHNAINRDLDKERKILER